MDTFFVLAVVFGVFDEAGTLVLGVLVVGVGVEVDGVCEEVDGAGEGDAPEPPLVGFAGAGVVGVGVEQFGGVPTCPAGHVGAASA